MTAYNPIGYVVANQRGPSLDWLIDHARKAQLLTVTFLDMNREAGDFQRATGCPCVTSRIYPFEPHANTADIESIRRYAYDRFDDVRRLRDDAQNGNVLFQINNEQGFRADDWLMYTYMLERSQALNDIIGMVFWNGASGSVTTGFWGQPNQWTLPEALTCIDALNALRHTRLPNGAYAYLLGVHGYTSQYPLMAVNAGQWRLDSVRFKAMGFQNLWDAHEAFLNGTLKIDWNLAQDHMARNYQGIMKALGWLPTGDGEGWQSGPNLRRDSEGQPTLPPWTLMTERGFDNMNDVRQVHWNDLVFMTRDDGRDWARASLDYAQSLGLKEHTLQVRDLRSDAELVALASEMDFGAQQVSLDTPRGYRSLEDTWKKPNWFPGKSMGEVMAYCGRWEHEVIYRRTGAHIGGDTYILGDTSGPNFWWVSFNAWHTGEGREADWNYFKAQESIRIEIAPHFLGAPTLPDDDPIPPPIDVGVTMRVRLRPGQQFANLRDAPRANGQVVGKVLDGQTLVVYPDEWQMAGYRWRRVLLESVEGFLAVVGMTEATKDYEVLLLPVHEAPPAPDWAALRTLLAEWDGLRLQIDAVASKIKAWVERESKP